MHARAHTNTLKHAHMHKHTHMHTHTLEAHVHARRIEMSFGVLWRDYHLIILDRMNMSSSLKSSSVTASRAIK